MSSRGKGGRNRATTTNQATGNRHSGAHALEKSNPGKRTGGVKKTAAMSRRTRVRKKSPGITTARSEVGEAGSLIGGIRSSGIRAKKDITSTPVDPEPTDEERRQIWQPPVIDTSRFSGTSSSRHSSTPSDRMAAYEGRHGKVKKRRARKKTSKAKGAAATRGATVATIRDLRTPLSDNEIKSLDDAYRTWGGRPEWKGWDKLLPRRTKDFLLAEAHRLGLDSPDDSTWTQSEARVFALNRNVFTATSDMWATLLPRKSALAIARAYGVAITIPKGRSKSEKRRAYRELAAHLARATEGLARKREETTADGDDSI